MSNRVTNHYSEEFKQSSAKLAAESEQPISQTAKDLGIWALTPRRSMAGLTNITLNNPRQKPLMIPSKKW